MAEKRALNFMKFSDIYSDLSALGFVENRFHSATFDISRENIVEI